MKRRIDKRRVQVCKVVKWGCTEKMGRNEWIEIESVKFKKRRVGISLIRPSVLPTKCKKNTAKKTFKGSPVPYRLSNETPTQHKCCHYSPTVHSAPNRHPSMTHTIAPTCTLLSPSWPNATAPFAIAANVVAKGIVGFGPPLIVTVGTLSAGDGGEELGVALGARTVKRFDVACMTPCVELIKIRK